MTEFLKSDRPLILDGAMGTVLDGMREDHTNYPERLNLSEPGTIKKIHRAYFDAGADIVCTNTFGANGLRYGSAELREIITSAVSIAKEAASESRGNGRRLVALDVGPLGRLLEPLGDIGFEQAVGIFSEVIRAGAGAGADLVMIETLNDLYEAKAAVLAAKESAALPVFASCAYSENGRLMTGADPVSVISVLEGLGADAIGVNCSFGPDALMPVLDVYLKHATVPVFFKPNAGMPELKNGRTCYDIGPSDFAKKVSETVGKGVFAVGGCCGTTPDYIKELSKKAGRMKVGARAPERVSAVCSGCRHVVIGGRPVIIGERINPTGKKRLKQAVCEGDTGYIVSEGLRQQEAGADIIDVNVGVPGTDEKEGLVRSVSALQSVVSAPLQLDSADPDALGAAMRIYNGRPLVNSVNGKAESMERIFPLVKKYGGMVVALLLDEDGIPGDPAGRLMIAGKIAAEADRYGIPESDILFDALTMPVGADPGAASLTLATLKALKNDFGYKTVLGVSNVSYGLPCREKLNSAFLGRALAFGLDAAIVDPTVPSVRETVVTSLALSGADSGFEKYIAMAGNSDGAAAQTSAPAAGSLRDAVYRGMKDEARRFAEEDAARSDPLGAINGSVIPALDDIGRDYEDGKAFLPGLLACAAAADEAFGALRPYFEQTDAVGRKKARIIMATVRGDVHDIGKNIVTLLLRGHGFDVTDLGKDVPPETVLEAVENTGAALVGLSALMTTTLPSMAETVRLLKSRAPGTKIMVGGAVLTQEYADFIGADGYAPDGMAAVRLAERLTAD